MADYFTLFIGYFQCNSMQSLQIKLRTFTQNLGKEEAESKALRQLFCVNIFTFVIAVSAIAWMTLYCADYSNNLLQLSTWSTIAGVYEIIFIVFMIWSFYGLNKVINYLFDG